MKRTRLWKYVSFIIMTGIINGQLYRRGFNLDTGEWETDWELVS